MITEKALSFYSWLRLHPIKAWVFSWLFGATSAGAGLSQHPVYWLGLFLVLFSVFLLNVWRDSRIDDAAIRRALRMKNVISSALVVVSLLFSGMNTRAAEPIPAQPPQQAGTVGVAVVVVVVGGVFTYYLVKTCQRLFPKTDPSTNGVSFHLDGETSDDYAASYSYSSYGSCYTPPDLYDSDGNFIPAPVMKLTFRSEYDGVRLAKLTPVDGESATQNVADFKADLARHGIGFSDHGWGVMMFGKNGRPATEAEVPIRFDTVNRAVDTSNGQTANEVILERSADLQTWEPIMRTKVAVGQSFNFSDVTGTSQMFYRVTRL